MPVKVSLTRWWIAPLLFGVALGIAATWMRSRSDDQASESTVAGSAVTSTLAEAPDATLVPPDLAAVTTVPADAAAAGLDPDYLAGVLADDTVDATELTAAYEAYVACLAVNGGSGFYAYDVELRTPLNLDWRLAADAPADRDGQAIDGACSSTYLGDLQRRYDAATPPPDDLIARRRQSIVDCLEPISPEAAAAVPDELTVTTDNGLATIDDLLLAPEVLSTVPGELDAVTRCVSSYGAEWRPFDADG